MVLQSCQKKPVWSNKVNIYVMFWLREKQLKSSGIYNHHNATDKFLLFTNEKATSITVQC